MTLRWLLALAVVSFFLQTSLCQDDAAKTEQVYRVGGSIKAPHAIYSPAPEYPKRARKDGQVGTVALTMVVGADGLQRDIKVVRSLTTDFDDAAIEAVKRWKFVPGTKDGEPVAVKINVELSFR
jgi:periplasmic protein TonB